MRARVVLLLVSLVVVGGCATVDPREDTRIEAEVKARLVAEKDANLTRLGVVSSNATVYLSGTVESPDQRARARTLAAGVRGVQRVVDTLEVRPPPK
jgi:hyperosmotically inducible periplasmic protein